MIFFFLLLIILSFVGYSFFTAEKDFFHALSIDVKGGHKEAIYQYALAAVTSCFFKEISREQIRHLWKKYGAFDYLNFYDKYTNPRAHENMISHDAIVEIIKNSITSL
jgi:hypothetical protein